MIDGIQWFYEWFTDTKEETFGNHVISFVRRTAQLSSSDRFTTNSSANCIVKKWAQFTTKRSQPAFVDKCQDLVALQYTHADMQRAIYGGGEFTLAPPLSS